MKRMKIIWVIAALFAVSTMAEAQFRFGVKGGVNISKVKFNRNAFESDNVTGFHVGPALEAMFGGTGFDLALLYSQIGFETKDETVKNSYLEVPLNLKLKINLPLVKPYVAAGPYVGFRVAGDKIWDVRDHVNGVVQEIKARSFGAGLNFTAGAEVLKFLQIGFTYSLGLTDDYKTFRASDVNSYKGKPHTWKVSTVVFF
jgi:hypothetical protein